VTGTSIDDAQDAARVLEPLTVPGLDAVRRAFRGAALLAVAIVPLSTAYSIAEGFDEPSTVDDRFG
jgi:hypothetical protein